MTTIFPMPSPSGLFSNYSAIQVAGSDLPTALAVTIGASPVGIPAGADLIPFYQGGVLKTATLTQILSPAGLATPFLGVFVGSGLAANMTANSSAVRDSSATPFVGMQRTVTSNYGLANAGLNFTVGESVSVLGGPNSGNLYGLNPIAQGYAGAGGYQLTVAEFNLNNIGADAFVLGASTAAYGVSVTAAGTAKSTAGFRAYGLPTPAGFNYGFGTHGNIVNAAFYDASTSASSSFVGQSGAIIGSITQSRQALIHGYSAGGNAFQILGWLEQDNGGTGTSAQGFAVSYGSTEARSAKAGIGLTRTGSNGRGDLSVFNRNTNDTASFTAADVVMTWGATENTFYRSLVPSADNTLSLGKSGGRLAALWAVNGAIQTSDVTLKADITPLPTALPIIASLTPITFRWLEGGWEDYEETTEEEQVSHAFEWEEIEVSKTTMRDGVADLSREIQRNRVLLYDYFPVFENGQPVMTTVPPTKKTPSYETPLIHKEPRMVRQLVPVVRTKRRAVPGKRTHWGFSASNVKASTPAGMDWAAYVRDADGTEHIRPDQIIPVLVKALQELSAEVALLRDAVGSPPHVS
jgi:hypothetical protein